MTRTVYSIGHSTHPLEEFLQLLKSHGITALVDIRSFPSSTHNPQFNGPVLKSFLAKHHIKYLPFGKTLGARPSNPLLLDESGQVDFQKVQRSLDFKRGMDRIKDGINKNYTIAVMSSKTDPISCHRFALLGPVLLDMGYSYQHILADGQTKSQEELEEQMLQEYGDKIPQPDIFTPKVPKETQLATAYRLKNNDIGFVPKKSN